MENQRIDPTMYSSSRAGITEVSAREPSIPPGSWSRLAPAGCSILLIVLQPVVFFWRVLINPSAHIPFDIEGFHLPLIAYLGQCLRRGIAPLWDPYPYCGVPIHADLTAQTFYPFTWLAILAGNHSQGRNLFYWVQSLVPLHMILAGLFVYLLLRRMQLDRPAAVLGASVFQLGGATFSAVEPNRLELSVHTQSRGLLVLSEMFYPGWRAAVNGRPAGIYRADVGLRGVIVPPGDSRITLDYTPWSIYLGGLVTLLAFLGILAAPRFRNFMK
jgi:hypothetical protein